jgi:hypothetical protein
VCLYLSFGSLYGVFVFVSWLPLGCVCICLFGQTQTHLRTNEKTNTTHPRASQKTNAKTPESKPKNKCEHTLEQAKRQIQGHLRAIKKTNTNTP